MKEKSISCAEAVEEWMHVFEQGKQNNKGSNTTCAVSNKNKCTNRYQILEDAKDKIVTVNIPLIHATQKKRNER